MELEHRYLKSSQGEEPVPTEQEVLRPRLQNLATLIPMIAHEDDYPNQAG
jgi:hypothetical protein